MDLSTMIINFLDSLRRIANAFEGYLALLEGGDLPPTPPPPIDPPDPNGDPDEDTPAEWAWLDQYEAQWSRSDEKAFYRVLPHPNKNSIITKEFKKWTKPDEADKRKAVFGHPPPGARTKVVEGNTFPGFLKAVPGALNKDDPLKYVAADGGAKIEIILPVGHVIDSWAVERIGEFMDGELVLY